VDNLNNLRREASRQFRNIKKAYFKANIDELENNSKIKNMRDFYGGINFLRKVTSLELIYYRIRAVILLQTPNSTLAM